MSRALVLVALAACVRTETVECADGSVCPAGAQCVAVAETFVCATADQLTSCVGAADFAACPGGVCFAEVCITPSCGDGRRSPIEVCDDGNTVAGDGCSSDCRSDETCGNGVVDLALGETCDDGAEGAGRSHDGCSSTCIEERPRWTTQRDLDELLTGYDWTATYDTRRARVLVFARAAATLTRMLEFDGAVWTDVTPTLMPSQRSGPAMVYDHHRDRAVLFGGPGLRETWEWDGATWALQTPPVTPPARQQHAMVYDPVHRRVVVFGGRRATEGLQTELNDTWSWDGTTWTQLLGPGPSARGDAAMAFDPVTGTIVLYGGQNPTSSALGDTWILDGVTWIDRGPGAPGLKTKHALVFDVVSQRVLLVGGRASNGGTNQTTWAWDGAVWTLRSSDTLPDSTKIAAIAAPERGIVHFLSGNSVWQLTPTGWTMQTPFAQGGVHRLFAAAARDSRRQRVVFVGGVVIGSTPTDRTDAWSGAWSPIAVTPSEVMSAGLAYDERADEMVLFGGQDLALETSAETWTLADATWTRHMLAVAPRSRAAAMLVYHAARGVSVLFGGSGSNGLLADTWTWDGAAWTEVAAQTHPSARNAGAMAYDPIRGEVVLFGGFANGFLDDTWVWNGAWTLRTVNGPSGRSGAGMAWDAARRRLVLFGGTNEAANALSDVWEWTGSAWEQVPAPAISGRTGHVVVSAPSGAGVVAIGANGVVRSEVEVLRWDATDTPRERCVVADDTDGDTRASCEDPDCWFVCARTCPPETSCSAPSCGDNACDGNETCVTCPDDCGACSERCGDARCSSSETIASCPGDCP